jgi:hypothetical protein
MQREAPFILLEIAILDSNDISGTLKILLREAISVHVLPVVDGLTGTRKSTRRPRPAGTARFDLAGGPDDAFGPQGVFALRTYDRHNNNWGREAAERNGKPHSRLAVAGGVGDEFARSWTGWCRRSHFRG